MVVVMMVVVLRRNCRAPRTMNGGIRVITGEMVGLIRARRREESRAVFVFFRDRETSSVRFWKVRNDLGTGQKRN